MIASAQCRGDEAKQLLRRALELNSRFDLNHAPEAARLAN
jgi:hypothetical protein